MQFDLIDPKPGIYDDIPISLYHGGMKEIGFVSNSYLGKLNKCPAAAKVPEKETDSLLFGRALHKYVLENDRFADEFFPMPEKLNMRTNAGKEAFARFEAENIGKQIVHAKDMQIIREMRDAIMSNPRVAALLTGGQREVTIVWKDEETGIWCTARPDLIPDSAAGVVLDLKTTKNAGRHPFQTSIVTYGYARQGAMILHGLKQITGKPYDVDGIFACIAVESDPPYRTEVYPLDDQFLKYGFNEFKRLLRIEAHCREQNYYPNFTPANLLDLRQASFETMLMPGYLDAEAQPWEMETAI